MRALIEFRRLNFMDADFGLADSPEVIFCRNVIIYFDKPTQRRLFERLAALQRPGDLLFLGHSESLYRVSEHYDLIGRTIYRRLAN
jgi:chemotaxis protein methyltransferase CheR